MSEPSDSDRRWYEPVVQYLGCDADGRARFSVTYYPPDSATMALLAAFADERDDDE